MQKLKDNHARELNRTNEQHQQEVNSLKRIIEKAKKWFPSIKVYLEMENLSVLSDSMRSRPTS